MPFYHNSEDEKLVEKIRGIVKDVVGCTPRYLKTQSKQAIVVSTKSASTSNVTGAVTTVAKAEAQKNPNEAMKEKKTDDGNGKK